MPRLIVYGHSLSVLLVASCSTILASNLSASGGDTSLSSDSIDQLRSHHLLLPLESTDPEQWKDSFYQMRGERLHLAADMMAARETPVHAVEDGVIARMNWNAKGGNTIYQKDPSGQFSYYYAHLQRYQDGVKAGDFVRRGQVIGYVGTTGNAPANCPHLHFSIERCANADTISGTPVNPYDVFAVVPFAPDRKAYLRGLARQIPSPSRFLGTASDHVEKAMIHEAVSPASLRSTKVESSLMANSPPCVRSASSNSVDRAGRDIGLRSPRRALRSWLGEKTRKWLRLGLQ